MNLIEALATLPHECSYQFELELKKIEINLGSNGKNDLYSIINNEGIDEGIRYAAFYCLANIYRHNLELDSYNELLNSSHNWKTQHDSLVHLKTLAYLIPPYKTCDSEILAEEYKLACKYRDTIGYKHAFTELFATVCEQEQSSAELKKQWGKKAERFADEVIEANETYAKYYCTSARILAINGKYDEADLKLQNAIQKEDSNRQDYAIIIGQYQYFRLSIQAKKLAEQLDTTEIQSQINRMQDSATSNIEIIAIFSGIISFAMGSLSLADHSTPANAILLISALMGALLFVYSSFCCLLRLPSKKASIFPYIIFIVVGILVVIISLATALVVGSV